MGIENFIEEAAGAFVADKGLEAVDPNAGILAKAAAAVAGFEGVAKVKDYMDEPAAGGDAAPAAAPDDSNGQ